MNSDLREACRRPADFAPGSIYPLPALAARGFPRIPRLPRVLQIVLESLLRNCDGERVQEHDVTALANWSAQGARSSEIPFIVSRIVLQDVAGIPLLGDLAAMRDAMAARGGSPAAVKPHVPVDMVIDHSLSVDHYASPDALARNMRIEVERNHERFSFVKWAMSAIEGVRLVPPGFGILHQVNLEFLSPGLMQSGDVFYPDTLVGTDSHSCMIAGLGVVGWGVGGIEAEAAMLGQPVGFLTPDVIAVELTGRMREGVTATDLVLHLTHRLRKAKVVGKFLEFIGDGTASLTVPDRATIANMAPEYGATIGFFPFDGESACYLRDTGRDAGSVDRLEAYWRQQDAYGLPSRDSTDYTDVITVDLASVVASVAGPKRPQDLVPLTELKSHFASKLGETREQGGYARADASLREMSSSASSRANIAAEMRSDANVATDRLAPSAGDVRDGDVVIASITSCTNTSNPEVMLAAGMLAQKAIEAGLMPPPWVKTSLAPGSLVVSRYLEATGLQASLDRLGFGVVGYGCATCVGNSGPLAPELEKSIADRGTVACAVLSGNRNFEGRIHPSVDAAFLMSPPLVVAYALAGTVNVEFDTEPLARGRDGSDVYLRDLWPSSAELADAMKRAADAGFYREVYGEQLGRGNPAWDAVEGIEGRVYPWRESSTYIKQPPYFTDAGLQRSSLRNVVDARILAIFGDSVTTDHISPIGNIAANSPAGSYLREHGVAEKDFNSYGARRMNHEVMTRGTFANRLIRNLMLDGRNGGVTRHWPTGDIVSIFDAATRYAGTDTPVVIFAGRDYGMGSARDWAAKGTRLLGVRAVIARSFERIHRSNLAGMGVLPCELPESIDIAALALDGSETVGISGLDRDVEPGQPLELRVRRMDGSEVVHPLRLRLDTPSEIAYAKRGGILGYVLDTL